MPPVESENTSPPPGSVTLVGAGPGAPDLIAEYALAMATECNAQSLMHTIHAHPTLSETLMEAAESVFGQATHSYRPKR